MTLLDRDLNKNEIALVVLRNPTAFVVAADTGDAILTQQESYKTREAADARRRIMNRRNPDLVYALGPSNDGPGVEGDKLVPDFVKGISIYAGPLKSNAVNNPGFRRIMEAMR